MENDWLVIRALSCANDREQAQIINDFARELFVRCGGRMRVGTIDGYESQVCNISRHLNKDGMTLIKDLHAFIELREKEI